MTVMLTLGRSASLWEANDIPDDTPDVVHLGPFDYVELTYDMLRVGPDGEHIGGLRDGLWYLDNDPHPFSDLDVWAGSAPPDAVVAA